MVWRIRYAWRINCLVFRPRLGGRDCQGADVIAEMCNMQVSTAQEHRNMLFRSFIIWRANKSQLLYVFITHVLLPVYVCEYFGFRVLDVDSFFVFF